MSATRPSLLFGASTGTGRQLLGSISGPVWAVSRAPCPSARADLRWLQADFASLQLPEGHPGRIYSMGPLPELIGWLQQQSWAPEVVVACSSSSAIVKRDSPDASERMLAVRLQELETRLLELGVHRGFRVCLLRPTLIWGGGRCALSGLARLARRWRLLPRPAGRGGARAPIHCSDLARAALALGHTDAFGIHALGGGEVLSMAAMVERVAQSVSARCLPVPRLLLQSGLNWARRRGLRFGAGMLARWDHDQQLDDRSTWQQLGLQPAGFAPRSSDWELA